MADQLIKQFTELYVKLECSMGDINTIMRQIRLLAPCMFEVDKEKLLFALLLASLKLEKGIVPTGKILNIECSCY
jgi:hypothetical protein